MPGCIQLLLFPEEVLARFVRTIAGDKERCICLNENECDCQNPPPDNWEKESGVYHTSVECPVHNDWPRPNPECPVHGGMSPHEFFIARNNASS